MEREPSPLGILAVVVLSVLVVIILHIAASPVENVPPEIAPTTNATPITLDNTGDYW